MSIDLSKLDATAWLTPPADRLSVAKLDATAWLTPPPDRLSVAKLEVVAWLTPRQPCAYRSTWWA